MDLLNMKCSNPKHHALQILFVCLNKECKDKRKCCLLCVDEQHQKHEILSIDRFIKEVNKTLQKNNKNPQKQEINKLLNNTRITCMKLFSQLRISFNHFLSLCQNKLHNRLNNIIQLLFQPQQQTLKYHILNTISQTDQTINEYLTLCQKAKKISIGTHQQMQKVITASLSILENKIAETGQSIEFSFHQIGSLLNKIQLDGKKYQTDFIFSDIHKSLSIKISDSKKTIQTLVQSQNYAINCFDKPLNPINNRFFIKVNSNPTKKLWMGVCILDIVKKSNFMACFGQGKGTYAINQSVSVTYNNPQSHATLSNHHLNNYNHMNVGFNFKQGDIIMVEVNYSSGNIIFHIINQNPEQNIQHPEDLFENFYQMPIQFDLGEFYPFVGFNGSARDQVAILGEEEIQKLMSPFASQWALLLEY